MKIFRPDTIAGGMDMRKRVLVTTLSTMLALQPVSAFPAVAGTASCEDLQRQLKQQREQIERLERTVEELRSQPAKGSRGNIANLDDPLVGTWQCTNKVFTYNMTFFADGLLLQESTTMGPMRELSWRRLAADEILLSGGSKVRVNMSGKDELLAERQGTMTKWECSRVKN